MPSMIAHIVKDENTFMVRFYKNKKDIGERSPVDVYECSDVLVNPDALEHLNDTEIVEFIGGKK
jgi:hypothetical protein